MLLLVLALLSIQTEPGGLFRSCMDKAGGVSMAMLQCGGAEIARVDARMNLVYRRLLSTMPRTAAARLRTEQRAWLRRHVRETRRLAGDPNNGSMALIDSQRFELQDLGERTQALERMLAQHR